MKEKKKLYVLVGACGIIITGLMIAFWNKSDTEWKKLRDLQECKNMFESSITEMTLRETIDHPEWVEFQDEDLIKMWTSYFNKLAVKEYNVPFWEMQSGNGGSNVITVQTEQGKIVFVKCSISDEIMMDINGKIYKIKEKEDMPFKETYNIAVTRYGTHSVFD